MKIGQNLRELKTLKKLKLKDIAGATGLSVSYISDILNGRANPSLETLLKLSDCLGVPAATLIGEEAGTYRTEAETMLYELLGDFSQWPGPDQADLLEYIEARKKIIRLRRKEK